MTSFPDVGLENRSSTVVLGSNRIAERVPHVMCTKRYLSCDDNMNINIKKSLHHEFNKISVIKELLNVTCNCASVPVLGLADIVFSIESLCTD